MLKLGTETVSLVNHLHSRGVIGQPEPEVGMGATLLCWTDRHAATIIEVIPDRKGLIIAVQQDNATRTDKNGFSESQTYDYSPNPNGHISHFRRLESGMWQTIRKNPRTGRWNKLSNGGVRIGAREEYWDPCF